MTNTMKVSLVKAVSQSEQNFANAMPHHCSSIEGGRQILTATPWLMLAVLLLAGVAPILGQEVPAPIPVDPVLVAPVEPPPVPVAPVAPAPIPVDPPPVDPVAPAPPPIDPVAPAPVPGPIDGGAIGGLPSGGGGVGGVRNVGGNTNRTNPREIARANAPTPTSSTNAIVRRQVVQQVQRISLRGPRSDGTNNVGGSAGTNGVERMNPRLFARQNAPAQTTNAVAALPMQRVPQQAQRLNLRVRTPLGGTGAAAGNGGNVVPAGGGIAAGNVAPPIPPPIDPNAVPLGN